MAVLSTLKPVVRPPALTLEEVKRYLRKRFPELCVSPVCLFAGRDLDGCELFGQSPSLRKGFAKQGLKLESFDGNVAVFPFLVISSSTNVNLTGLLPLPSFPFNVRGCHKSNQGLHGSQNIHEEDGLLAACVLMAKVKPGCLVWLSPTCASWIWLSRGSTRRGLALKLQM